MIATEDKKEILTRKAAQLFLVHGYHNVGMKRLAETVGLQPSAIYYYFKGKEEILRHIEDTYARKFRENVVTAMDQTASAEEKIRILIKRVIELLLNFPEISLFMTQQAWPGKSNASIKSKEREFVRTIRSWLGELAVEKGLDRPIESSVAVFSLIGMTSWICKWFSLKGRLSVDDLVREVTRLFFEGFYDGQATFGGFRYLDESPACYSAASPPSDKATKEWLLNKAAELFVEQGYRKTSMRQIAEATNIQAPAIYYHFKNKEDLFTQLDEQNALRFKEHVIDAVKGLGDSEAKVEMLLRRVLFLITNYGETALLLTDQAASKKAGRIRKQKAREFVHFIKEILDDLVKVKGIEQPVDTTVATFCLIGMSSWCHRWYRPGGAIRLEDLTRDMTRLFFHGYCSQPITPYVAESRFESRPIEEGLMALPPASPIPHLLGGKCSGCGRYFFPRREICTHCFDQGTVEEVELGSAGKLISWTVVRRGMPAGKGPYALGYIELPEGLTILAPLSVPDFEDLRIGMLMQAVFEEEIDQEMGNVVVYRFRPL